jgi:small subunit ribosomal protein S17
MMNTATDKNNPSLPTDYAGLPAGRQGKTFEGIVVKSAMKDTATVLVERYVKHPKYQKFMRLSKKFLAHDPGNTATVGSKVVIQETRPMSKRKHHIIVSTVVQAESAGEETAE